MLKRNKIYFFSIGLIKRCIIFNCGPIKGGSICTKSRKFIYPNFDKKIRELGVQGITIFRRMRTKFSIKICKYSCKLIRYE